MLRLTGSNSGRFPAIIRPGLYPGQVRRSYCPTRKITERKIPPINLPNGVKLLEGAPYTPEMILEKYPDDLTIFESNEIFDFPEIWYIGNKDYKENTNSMYDYTGYKKRYEGKKYDHIKYRYQILEKCGEGSFSDVFRCYDHKEKRIVAIKVMRAKKSCLEYVAVEVDIQKKLHSSHTVQVYESFGWRLHFCIVMEMVGLDVFSLFEKRRLIPFKIQVIQRIINHSLQALDEMAKLDIVHGDIKPENLLSVDDNFSCIKITDFGSACYRNKAVYAYIQSRYYRAPEIAFEVPYGPEIDMWSIGCIAYELLTGNPLFPAEDEYELVQMWQSILGPPPRELYGGGAEFENLTCCDPVVDLRGGREVFDEMMAALPQGAVPLIDGCLRYDPKDRITASEALELDWVKCEEDQKKNPRSARVRRLLQRVPWTN